MEPLGFWTQILLIMALLNFLLNFRNIIEARWIHNHVRHIEFHVCPDHEEWEEVRERLKGALEEHLRGIMDSEEHQVYNNAKEIEEWDNK